MRHRCEAARIWGELWALKKAGCPVALVIPRSLGGCETGGRASAFARFFDFTLSGCLCNADIRPSAVLTIAQSPLPGPRETQQQLDKPASQQEKWHVFSGPSKRQSGKGRACPTDRARTNPASACYNPGFWSMFRYCWAGLCHLAKCTPRNPATKIAFIGWLA